jgi:alkylhydroperoxidase family enzyme
MGAAVNRLSQAAYHKSILRVRVREAARIKIAQLNQCQVCLTFRADSVLEQGLTESFYASTESHSTAELLAGEYAERFALDHLGIDDAFFDRLHACFSDEEILDLTICIAAFLALGRTLAVIGITETSLTEV